MAPAGGATRRSAPGPDPGAALHHAVVDLGPVCARITTPAALHGDLARLPAATGSAVTALDVFIGASGTRSATPAPALPCRPAADDLDDLMVDSPWFDGRVVRGADPWTAHLRPLDPDVAPVGTERRVLAMLRMLTCMHTLAAGGLGLHGATVKRAGRATLFVGRRRAGKTTVVRRFSQGLAVLGDDLAVLTPAPSGVGFVAHGTPFAGRERTPAVLERAPLARICLIEQAGETRVEPLPAREAAALLLRHAFVHVDAPSERARALDAALRIVGAVPVLRLGVHLSTSPWSLEALA